jgi:hypothetical protein
MHNRDEWDQLVEQNEEHTLTLTLAQRNAIADANAYICELEAANRRLRDESADLLAVCEAIYVWCGTGDGAVALPFEPPWAAQLRDAITKAGSEP